MRLIACFAVVIALVVGVASPTPLRAQDRQGVMGELIRDVTALEAKIMGLAKAMPPTAYEWRPGPGVRSTAEVFVHLAGDNYYMPVLMGGTAPADTGIDVVRRHESVVAFEKRTMTRDQIIAELEKSFRFLKQAMSETSDASLEEQPKFERQRISTRGFWTATAAHLHEHLGQLIAYARSNNVTPPWSK
jgi:hypothetical protein